MGTVHLWMEDRGPSRNWIRNWGYYTAFATTSVDGEGKGLKELVLVLGQECRQIKSQKTEIPEATWESNSGQRENETPQKPYGGDGGPTAVKNWLLQEVGGQGKQQTTLPTLEEKRTWERGARGKLRS